MSEGNDKLEIGVNIPAGDLAKLDRMDKALDKLGTTATKAASAMKSAAPAGVDFANAFASPGSTKNIKAQEEAFGNFIKSASDYDAKVEKLGKASKTSLGRMAEAMKSIEKTGIAGTFKQAQEQMRAELSSGERMNLNLVRAQTGEIQSAYEHRLAKMGQLQGEELAAWRRQGARLGGFQASQLTEFKKAERLRVAAAAEQAAEEAARYEASLKSLASAQAQSDQNYIARRKESLARGAFLVSKVKKETGLSLTAAAEQAAEEAARYEASLKSLASAQAQSDQNYIARRKESLARGAFLVAQAKKEASMSVAAAEQARTANIGTTGQRLAGNEVVGSYTPYNALRATPIKAPAAPAGPTKPTPNDLKQLSDGFRRANDSANDLHSGVRGLASGFNALWLTWGNLGPLFIGAAISNGFVQTAKTGMQVAHTMEVIKVLGGNTAEEMSRLNSELDRMGKSGPFGPLEIANAMKSLSLAGLKANDILAVTKTVLDFSVAGTTDIETAAKTLMTVSTAFGMGAEGFAKVSDVVSKASALSLTSVESFSEAMKTASVIHKQYGVSLEDTATAIAAMSQLGIEGSAAGTALRNAYSDLSGRTQAVAKALKSVGIEARDVNGNFKPLIQVVSDLNEKMAPMTGAARKDFLQAVLSERGAKGIIELLDMVNTQVDRTGKSMGSALAQMQSELFDYYGFASISAAKLAQTSENQFKSLKATISSSMNEAFREMEPALLVTMDSLRRTFASPEFIQGLSVMVEGVARLGMVLSQNLSVIGAAVTAYTALKVVQMGSAAVLEVLVGAKALYTAATVRNTAAITAETAATVAGNAATAGKAAGMLGLARLIPGLNVAVGLGTAAWIGYDWWRSKSSDTAQTATDLYNNNVIKALNDEAARLEKLNELRRTGLTLAEAEAKVRGGEVKSVGVKAIDDLESKASKAWDSYRAAQTMTAPKGQGGSAVWFKNQQARLADLRTAASAASRAVADANINMEQAAKDTEKAALRQADARRAADALNAKTPPKPPGTQTFGGTGAGDGRKALTPLDLNQDNTLAELAKRNTTAVNLLDKLESDKLAILKVKREAEMINEGQYFAELLSMTRAFSDEKTALLELDAKNYSKAYEAAITNIKDATDKWKKSNPQATPEEVSKAVKDMETKISSAQNSAESFFEKISAEKAKAASATFRLVETEIIKVGKALHDLKKTSQEFWDAQDKAQVKAAAAAALDESLRYADPSYAAGVRASAAAQEALNDQYDKLVPNLKAAQENLDALISSQMDSGVPITAATDLMDKYNAQILALRTEMDQLKGEKGAGIKERAAATAKTILANSERDKLAGSLADAVIDGLTVGGDQSAKNLKKVLEDELSKPIKVNMQAMFSSVMGGTAFGGTGTLGGLGGPGSTILNNLSSLYDKLTGGLNVGANVGQFLVDKTGAGPIGSLLGEFGSGMTNTATMQSASMAAQAGGAQLAGVIAGSVLNGVSGYGISKALSGGFKIDGLNVDAIAGIASMIPGIGPVAGVIGGLVNRAFGHGSTEVRAQGTRGTFGSSGFSGENYANMHQQGGWFTSDRNWTETSAIDAAVTKRWTTAFEGVKSAASDSAKAMGLSAASIADYSKSIDIAAGATSDTVLAIFSGMADELAIRLVPNIAGFAVEGEAARDTLARLASSLTVVNTWLTATHAALYAVSVSGAVAATELLKAHGGLEKFASVSQAFYDTYYSNGEKIADSQTKMRKALALLGYALPATNDGFRKLVEGLDLNTEAGRNAHAVLLNLAPEFATTTAAVKTLAEEASKAATDAAEAILKAVTGSQSGVVASLGMVTSGLTSLASTATNPTVSSLAAATAASAAMSNELLFMNSIMGNSASSVLAFDTRIQPLSSNLTVAQTAAANLQQQIYDLSVAADSANIDFTKLTAALAAVDTATFMTTITKVFEGLAERVSKVMGDITSERMSVREAAIGIVAPQSLSKSQIESRISSIQSGGPSNSAVTATADRFSLLTSQLATSNAKLATAQKTVSIAQQGVDWYQGITNNLGAARTDWYSKVGAVNNAQNVVNATPSRLMRDVGPWFNRSSEAYTPEAYTNAVNALNAAKAAEAAASRAVGQWSATATNAWNALGGNAGQGGQTALNQAQNNVKAETLVRDALQKHVNTAQEAAKAAVLFYQKAMQDFVNSSSTSVTQLSKLKDETVKYYEAQKALADLLAGSAAGIRETIRSYKFSQMTDEQKANDLKSQFAQATLLAQSATGEGLVAASDKVNSLINPLIEALQTTGQDSLINKVLADAENVAALVDKNILSMGDYKADSLALLDLIDKKLLALGASTGTAQDVIAAAVAAGADKTSNGLRGVIAAILGQSIPAFATGGFHTGGVRLVGENGPELEATGPSRIYNAAQTQSLLAGSGGDSTARLEALIAQQAEIMRQQSRQLENMSYELRAIAGSTGYTSAVLKKVTQGGESLQTTEVAA
jgi:TP901 family phage tail tape measure protein